MFLGGGDLDSWLGHEGIALMSRIRALIKETPESSLPLLPCEDPARRHRLWTRKRLSADTESPTALILDFEPPEVWETNVYCILAARSLAFSVAWTKRLSIYILYIFSLGHFVVGGRRKWFHRLTIYCIKQCYFLISLFLMVWSSPWVRGLGFV